MQVSDKNSKIKSDFIKMEPIIEYESSSGKPNKIYPNLKDLEDDCHSMISIENETDNFISSNITQQNLNFYLKQRGENGEPLLVDYVLAWNNAEDPVVERKNAMMRQQLHNLLCKEGLILEEVQPEEYFDNNNKFLKIHATWDVLSFYAEFMHIKMPILNAQKKLPNVKVGYCSRAFSRLCNYLFEKNAAQEEYVCTASFRRDKQYLFLKSDEDKSNFFTHSQRSLLVDEAIRRVVQSKRDQEVLLDNEEGRNILNHLRVEKLISSSVYNAAFPLHEGPFEFSINSDGDNVLNDRQVLYKEWASWRNWYKYQPLHKIRRYYGERIAFYFCWLGFYTTCLFPIAVCGLLIFIYGLFTVKNNAPSNDICDNDGIGGSLMCPLCDKACSYWRLSSSCLYSQLSHVFDNRATIVFAILMSLWATLFLEFWKRRQNEVQYEWDVRHFEKEECVRPEYEEACGESVALNVVTGEQEPHLTMKNRAPRYFLSCATVFFMTSLVIAALVAVMIYRVIMVTVVYTWGEYVGSSRLKGLSRTITFTTAGLIQVLLIFGLNKIYCFLAIYITNMERPRTETDYEDSFTLKMYCFQFVNHYASLFYIAFFKGLFVGRPGSYQRNFFGYRLEECDPAGCLVELSLQMITIFGGQLVINNFIEFGVPSLKSMWRKKKENDVREEKEEDDNNLPQFEKDLQLNSIQRLQLFDEYLEMVIQFGFVSIFVAAFPLAPLFAFINNILEIRLDALKLVTFSRRPLATKAQDIGIWNYIMRAISIISVMTNALIIGWTSDAMPKMVYRFYYSNNTSLEGFVAWHLSVFDVNHINNGSQLFNISGALSSDDELNTCMYRGLRQAPTDPNPYSYSAAYWHVLCARCIFILLFEHFVFLLTALITWLVPDISRKVKIGVLQERYQVNRLVLQKKNS